MRIALDYDLTYTSDPFFWDQFIKLATGAGHVVRIVTIRDDRYDRTVEIAAVERAVPVIYTRGVAKRWFCSHFGDGFAPDIWIDDKPETVLYNSATTPEDLAVWRAERAEAVA